MTTGSGRKRVALTVVAALAVGAAVAPPAVAGHTPPAAPAATATVTLITGDKVALVGREVTVERAKGRETVPFQRWTRGGDTYVAPADAAPLLASGRLDRRLFNITQLIRHGYDDRSRAQIPLIVSGPGGSGVSAQKALPGTGLPGTTRTRALPRAGATAIRADKAATGKLWASLRGAGAGRAAALTAGGEDRIMLDGPVRAQLAESVPQIGAPQAWQAGHTGKGVTVAVVDSGIDTTHPDLKDAVVAATDLTGGGARPNPDDTGHGTHVASVITGSGAATDGTVKGVAPDTRLVDVKVLDQSGAAEQSTLIAGLEYAATSGAQVVNVSVGSDFQSEGDDPVSAAVDRLTAQHGVLFVVAAGNSGPAEMIGGPAAAGSALTVGAVDRAGELAWFSARGPRHHNGRIKPDITAPGTDIAAAYSGRGDTDGPYIVQSGTSMAAPHVAGAAALVAGQHPDWSPAEVKAALMGSATPTGTATVYEQGAGRVDVAKVTRQAVQVLTPSVDHGVVPWPHTDDAPIATPVTYVNSGSEPVTLTLAADVRAPGATAPADLVTVDPAQLTVPGGGRATATVTTRTRTAPVGVYSGALTATGPGTALRIPVAFDVEAERHDVAVSMRNPAGALTPHYGLRLTNIDTRQEWTPHDPDGTVRVRVPRGRYRFDGFVRTAGTATEGSPFVFDDYVLAVEPEIVVNRDVSVDVNGATAKPVALRVERPDARYGSATLDFDTVAGTENLVSYGWLPPDNSFQHHRIRPSTTKSAQFRFTAEGTLAKPAPDGSFHNSPYLYKLRSVTDGAVPAGVDRTYPDRDLAAVTTALAAGAPGRTGRRDIVSVDLPGTLTEYYTPGHAWYPEITQWNGAHRDHLTSSPVRIYQRGQRSTARWNTAVFGPSLPQRPGRTFHAERVGDQISFGIPMFGDGGVNNTGFTDSATTEKSLLYRGGELVGEYHKAGQGYFPVPTDAAGYRLHTELAQSGTPTSAKITADWDFRSAPGTGVQVLPLLAVRFSPQLDEWNKAPGGRFTFPVTVHRNGTGIVHKGVSLTVHASYDDGTTWVPVSLVGTGDRWTATVDHPVGAGFVTLRATARQADGNAVDQVITRAYAVR